VSQVQLGKHKDFVKELRTKLTFKSHPRKLTGVKILEHGELDPMMERLAAFVGGLLALGMVEGNLGIGSDLIFCR
jgi:hypothetical protein